jgi:hypothetical protein
MNVQDLDHETNWVNIGKGATGFVYKTKLRLQGG